MSPDDYEVPIGCSPVWGPLNAKVTIVQFGDLAYEAGTRFDTLVIDEVLDRYPSDVNYVFKRVPSQLPSSVLLAKAVAAANLQGKFWEMLRLIILLSEGNARRTRDGFFDGDVRSITMPQLERLARGIGVHVRRWRRDLESPEVLHAIEADVQLAESLGVRGDLPRRLFVNGSLVFEASYETLVDIVRCHLPKPLASTE